MVNWHVLDTGIHSAEENMRQDAKMLDEADILPGPTIHFYEWKNPSVTYGYFTNPAQLLNLEAVKALELDLARRPTGGGIVFHLFDMAFSIVVPSHAPQFSTNTLDNYAWVNQAVLQSVNIFLGVERDLTLIPEDSLALSASCSSFCMAKPTKYDVVWQGKKIAGSAQRKTRKGFLHQGTIALVMPSVEFLSQVLLPESQVQAAMLQFTSPLLGFCATKSQIDQLKLQLKRILTTQLSSI